MHCCRCGSRRGQAETAATARVALRIVAENMWYQRSERGGVITAVNGLVAAGDGVFLAGGGPGSLGASSRRFGRYGALVEFAGSLPDHAAGELSARHAGESGYRGGLSTITWSR